MTTTEKSAVVLQEPVTRRPQRQRSPWRQSPWLWLLPLSVVLLLVLVYPLVEIVRLSFTDASLVSGEPYRVTTDAYGSLVRGSDFRHTIGITFVFVLFSTVFQLLLGLGAALVVNGAERRGLRGTVFTRTTVMAAWAIPGVIIGIIWSLLYQESSSGILNYGLSLLGSSGQTPFLSDPDLALVSVTVANVWRGTALSMILCYAGLKTIPDDVYEAARMDGASSLQTLVRVTLPMMLPILLTNLVLVVVETFNTFDMVLSLTGGGPGNATEVLALGVYDQIFRQLNVGRGAAMAVVLLLINVVMIGLYLRLAERQERRV
jgi:multiple sugar transport system permease protein